MTQVSSQTKLYFFCLLICLCSLSTHAYQRSQPDFEVDGIYYMITNNVDKTVAVSYKEWHWNSVSDDYSGKVVIPSSVRYDGKTYTVTQIDEYAFYICTGLTEVVIPNSVVSIGGGAFAQSSIIKIEIPGSVKTISGGAFRDCNGLTEIRIPRNVTNIGSAILMGCTNLSSIVVEAGNPNYNSRDECNAIVETSTGKLISGCKNTVIYDGVKIIGESAFCNCAGLKSINIPNSVTEIEQMAFSGCGLVLVEIPDNVTKMGTNVFKYCTDLKRIVFGNGLTHIFYGTCEECTSLTSVTLPKNLIDLDGFAGCKNLKYIILPDNLLYINPTCFYECTSMTSITIPNSVISIGKWAFCRCYLKTVKCYVEEPFEIEYDAFDADTYNNGVLYVPEGSYEKYRNTWTWHFFKNIRANLTSFINPLPFNNKGSVDTYKLDGLKTNRLKKGVNIIRQKDGINKKFIIQ